ncbi:hypothetical protein GCM10007036_23210 [Alsobacter metallidurans]|uniref:Uncharacterized protein n=1 Tax=Alsobacter metallidurans TaxID=340221 RepID=A0A917I846_9HYPH|nr:hypothetical protein [Alsobacter metallidurans]GGH19946.1 hypothetical protein GCM10007036_23210 [Alsobacter metallidurans]
MPARRPPSPTAAFADPAEEPEYGPDEAEAELERCLRAINTQSGVWRRCGRGTCRRARSCRRGTACRVPRVVPAADDAEAMMEIVRADILLAHERVLREPLDDAPMRAAAQPVAANRARAAASPRCRSI